MVGSADFTESTGSHTFHTFATIIIVGFRRKYEVSFPKFGQL